jgi:hypothetical protein
LLQQEAGTIRARGKWCSLARSLSIALWRALANFGEFRKADGFEDFSAGFSVAFLRNSLLGNWYLCGLQNEPEGFGAPMKIFDNSLPVAGLLI